MALHRALLEWFILAPPPPPSSPQVVFTKISNLHEGHTHDYTHVPSSLWQTSSQEFSRESPKPYPSATLLACRAHARRS